MSDNAFRRSNYLVLSLLGTGAALYMVGGWWLHWWGVAYMIANALLALIPWLVTILMRDLIWRRAWRDWAVWAWGLVWLAFLPNSFYLVTDLTHIREAPVSVGWAALLYGWFALAGLAIGVLCLLALEPRRLRWPVRLALAEAVLLWCSVALYAGKVLRWNSWDLVLHPLALAQDAVAELVAPRRALEFSLVAFLGLSALYVTVWWVREKTRLEKIPR